MNAYANDPSSYRPVETVLTDTIRFLKLAHFRRTDLKLEMSTSKSKVEMDERDSLSGRWSKTPELRKYDRLKYIDDQIEYLSNKLALDVLDTVADSISTSPNKDPICAYRFEHSCRLKNRMGALVLNTYTIQTNPSGDILAISDGTDDLLLYPNMYGNQKPVHIPKQKSRPKSKNK
jgi:hypothetical protein